MLETDAHTKRLLPSSYVAEHVEHAYALTGHGMQGGTVERAIVVASVSELTRGWSYTALSRARGETRLLVRDTTPIVGDREDVGPGPVEPEQVLARVGRRMLERDDEDLALDQLHAPGRADDPQLADHPEPEPAQENAAGRAEPAVPRAGCIPLAELRDRLERLRAQLAALPTTELAQLDELDASAIELTERRDTVHGALERLPAPRPRRLRRGGDPHLVQRTELSSTLGGLEVQLERTLTKRGALTRELGDIEAIRDERDGLTSAIETVRRVHARLLDELVDRELDAWPQWTLDALGDRPDRPSDGRRWDRAARVLARYRIEYDQARDGDPLGPEPAGGDQRRGFDRAQRAREELAHDLGREPHGNDLGLG